MARTLVIACDGTWSDRTDDTNVARLHAALAETPTQLRHYVEGLGSTGNPLRRLVDGAFGAGLAEQIEQAYRWIADTWTPGDSLVLVGFSRGAFTVRSLVGMLTGCGLVRFPEGATDAERDRIVHHVFRDGYRARVRLTDVTFAPGFGPDDRAPITFLGVWDTVGALGVPRTFGLLSRLVGRERIRFHDTSLDPDVRHARQALALDEQRGAYIPAVWATPEPGTHESFAQLWFPGGHGDVGGGDPGRALADTALGWMAAEATRTVGLEWTDDLGRLRGDPCGPDSAAPTGIWRYLYPRPRTAPHVVEGAPDVHPSAVARRACGLVPPYRPGVAPAPGDQRDVVVAADAPWVETGLYLPIGRYRLAVSGTWSDHGAATPATGWVRWPVLAWPAYGLGSLLAGLRTLIRRVSSPRADLVAARRVPGARWMELVAAVANDVLHTDGTLDEGTLAPIGPDGARELDVPRPGYLYAFADDAWTGYGSNAGAVTLTVRRLDDGGGDRAIEQ